MSRQPVLISDHMQHDEAYNLSGLSSRFKTYRTSVQHTVGLKRLDYDVLAPSVVRKEFPLLGEVDGEESAARPNASLGSIDDQACFSRAFEICDRQNKLPCFFYASIADF